MVARCVVNVMEGLAGTRIRLIILHGAEVPVSEGEVILGEAEGEGSEAVKVPLGEAEGVTDEAEQVPLGEADREVSLGEEY